MARTVSKVPAAEKGTTKDTKPNSRSKAWKVSERASSRWAQTHDGPNPFFTKLCTSTGRLGHLVDLQLDSSSKHYAIEVKRRESAPAWLADCWKQIIEIAADYSLSPLLMIHLPKDTFTKDGKEKVLPVMHIITAERHEKLLQYERRCEDNATPIAKTDAEGSK